MCDEMSVKTELIEYSYDLRRYVHLSIYTNLNSSEIIAYFSKSLLGSDINSEKSVSEIGELFISDKPIETIIKTDILINSEVANLLKEMKLIFI